MAADPLVGKLLADRFEIVERVGEGGTGVVYRAIQTNVDREVAIKVLGAHVSSDPSWVKRFQNEARAVAKLHHPNTVQLIDFGQTREGLLFIAMEFLHGRSLRDEIDRAGKLPPQRALRIIVQACGSVGEAHGLNIIHRDIKPDNLYLLDMKGAGDSVKVLDFSVAKMNTGDNQQTRAGIVFGTPAYMSPEQGRGAKLGPQSDIYAFGIVLYEMLSGKPPFDSKIPTEVVMMHLRDAPKPLSGFPDALGALVLRTLDKDPAKRQQSCEQLAAECEQVLAELYPHQTPPGMRQATGAPQPVTAPTPRVDAPAMVRAAGAPPPAAYGTSTSGRGTEPRAPPEARAMIADAAQPQRGGSTMIADGAAVVRQSLGADTAGPGTMILPDSRGVIAFELARAEAARQAAAQIAGAPLPAHWTFWAAWAVIGIGVGLMLHYLLRLAS